MLTAQVQEVNGSQQLTSGREEKTHINLNKNLLELLQQESAHNNIKEELEAIDILTNNNLNNARMAKYYRSPSLLAVNNDHGPVEMTESANHPLLKMQRKLSKSLIDPIQQPKEQAQQAYSLPENYEYPKLVSSFKHELFITACLYLLNIVSAVGIVLVNKFIYTHYNFPHGLVLTLYHFVLTSIGLKILAAVGMFPIKPVKLVKVLPLSISFCSYVVLTNLSLLYNSGTFYQVKKEKRF